MSVEGSVTQKVVLQKSKVALQLGLGSDVKALAANYGLSVSVMSQALEEMGLRKRRADAKPVVLKTSKYDEVSKKYNLTEEQVKNIIIECGYKVKEGRHSHSRYEIINDIKGEIAVDNEVVTEEPTVEED